LSQTLDLENFATDGRRVRYKLRQRAVWCLQHVAATADKARAVCSRPYSNTNTNPTNSTPNSNINATVYGQCWN